MVKFSKAPVNKTQFAVRVIDHDVVRLDIPMHDSLGVAEVERFENLVDVIANIEVSKCFVERAEVYVASIDEFHDESRGFSHWVAHDIQQVDDVDTVSQSLQDFDLASDLCFLDRLKDLDDDAFVVQCIDALVDLRVLASAYLFDNLVVVLRPKFDFEILVVAILGWQLGADIGIVLWFEHRHIQIIN